MTPPEPSALRMQILTTEHMSLLSSRSLAWSESFSRAGMHLSTLSGAMVALGLVAGIDHLGRAFVAFALLVLPVVLFVGLATFVRMGAVNYHDAMTVMGMNRIRGAYLELAPELEPYFVMGVHDDTAGVSITMAIPPGSPHLLQVMSATPFVVNVVNAVVAAAFTATLLIGVLGFSIPIAIAGGVAVLALAIALQLRLVSHNMRRGRGSIRPIFPTGARATTGPSGR